MSYEVCSFQYFLERCDEELQSALEHLMSALGKAPNINFAQDLLDQARILLALRWEIRRWLPPNPGGPDEFAIINPPAAMEGGAYGRSESH